jgi:hypothetical protein
MSIKDIVNLIVMVIQEYLSKEKFTGKIIFTIHFRDGSVGKCSKQVEENYFNKSSCEKK